MISRVKSKDKITQICLIVFFKFDFCYMFDAI